MLSNNARLKRITSTVFLDTSAVAAIETVHAHVTDQHHITTTFRAASGYTLATLGSQCNSHSAKDIVAINKLHEDSITAVLEDRDNIFQNRYPAPPPSQFA
jgi:hypothetical protein